MSRHSRGEVRIPLVAGSEIPSLVDKASHNARKSRRIERVRSRQVEKISHRFGSFGGQHFDNDRALFRLERHALPRHFLHRGAVERLCL